MLLMRTSSHASPVHFRINMLLGTGLSDTLVKFETGPHCHTVCEPTCSKKHKDKRVAEVKSYWVAIHCYYI